MVAICGNIQSIGLYFQKVLLWMKKKVKTHGLEFHPSPRGLVLLAPNTIQGLVK